MNADKAKLRQRVIPALDDESMLVSQVQAVDRHCSGRIVVQLDRRIDDLPFAWSEARLLNRKSSVRSRLTLIVRRPSRVDMVFSDDLIAVQLPGDIRMGDLIAVPARTLAAVEAVREMSQLT